MHDNWSPMSALVGSGNLTRKGLHTNVEVMVEAHGSDMRQAWDIARNLWGEAWPCADRLAGYLASPAPPARPPRNRAAAPVGRPPTAIPSPELEMIAPVDLHESLAYLQQMGCVERVEGLYTLAEDGRERLQMINAAPGLDLGHEAQQIESIGRTVRAGLAPLAG